MRLTTCFRVGTVAAIALTVAAGYAWPALWQILRTTLVWVIPIWIALLFLIRTLATPNALGTTPLEVWWNRLRGRTWRCPRCGHEHPFDVPLCGDCAELRPEE